MRNYALWPKIELAAIMGVYLVLGFLAEYTPTKAWVAPTILMGTILGCAMFVGVTALRGWKSGLDYIQLQLVGLASMSFIGLLAWLSGTVISYILWHLR